MAVQLVNLTKRYENLFSTSSKYIAHPLSVWWKNHYVAMAFSLVWELQELQFTVSVSPLKLAMS